MHLEELLEKTYLEFKLDAIPQKNKQGVYELILTPKEQVHISELNPGLFFIGQILPLPEEGNKEALFIHLMRANFLGQGTGGGAIGIDEKEKRFLFSLSINHEIGYSAFKEALEDFFNYTSYWKEEITRLISSPI